MCARVCVYGCARACVCMHVCVRWFGHGTASESDTFFKNRNLAQKRDIGLKREPK